MPATNQQQPTTHQRIANANALAALFSSSKCKKTYLGKGDTFFGIDQIREWILSNHDEIDRGKAVALFQGATLQETIANIHFALHTHFKYDADGYEQQLRAPNCAWSQRNTGLDCKSFTVLASVFLLKLGIKHHLRKIKQPFGRPDEYSHIYVVVPQNQETANLKDGYYTLDGTLKSNIEPIFTTHHDIFMEKLPYYGLKGVQSNVSPIQNPITETAIQGFLNYLKFLAACGVSQRQLDKIGDALNSYLAKGTNPVLHITAKGISIGDLYVPYLDANGALRFSGFKNAIDVANALNGTGRLNGPVIDPDPDTSPNPDSDEIAGFLDVLKNLFSSGFFGNTFGNIFSNGMEFSCWNSTFTPAQTTQQVNQVHIPFVQTLFNNIRNANNEVKLKKALDVFDKTIANHNKFFWDERVGNNWEKCSRLALDVYTEYYRGIYPKIPTLISSLSGKFNITSTTATAKTVIPSVYDKQTGPAGHTYTYRIYTVKIKDGVIPDTTNDEIPDVTIPDTTNNDQQQDNNDDNSNGNDDRDIQKAGFGNVLFGGLLVGTALLYGAKALKEKKNPKQKKNE